MLGRKMGLLFTPPVDRLISLQAPCPCLSSFMNATIYIFAVNKVVFTLKGSAETNR